MMGDVKARVARVCLPIPINQHLMHTCCTGANFSSSFFFLTSHFNFFQRRATTVAKSREETGRFEQRIGDLPVFQSVVFIFALITSAHRR